MEELGEPRGVGDLLGDALARIGVTADRVSQWLGTPCGCRERRDRMNRLHFWARRVMMGRIERAAEYLASITGEHHD